MGAIMWWNYYSTLIYTPSKLEYILQNYYDYNKRRIQVRWVNIHLRAITFHLRYIDRSDQKLMRTLMADDDGIITNN